MSIYELCKPAYTIIHHFLHHTKYACPTPSNKGCKKQLATIGILETRNKRKHGISVIPGLGIYGTSLLSCQPSITPTTSSVHGHVHLPSPSFLFVSGTKKSDSLGCVVSGGRKRCKPQPNNNFVGRIVPTGMLYWQWMLTWPCSIKVNYKWNMCSWPWQPWHKMCLSP